MYASKKKCLQEDGDTKKLLAAGAAYKKTLARENFSIPLSKKLMVRSL